MKELDVDLFALETADKQDARQHFAKDWTAKLIGIVMVLFFCSYIGMITIMPPEQNSMELINLVLGYMGGLVSAVVSFYFGASQKQD
jgi:predicted nucleic acid-binding protein